MSRTIKILIAFGAVVIVVGLTALGGLVYSAYFFASRARAEKLAHEGYVAAVAGNRDTALEKYAAALKEKPTLTLRAWLYANRGSTHNLKWSFDEAIRDFDEAIKLDPKMAYAYAGRGWSYLSKGENDRALADINEAIKLDPNSETAFYNRAVISSRKRFYRRAIDDLNEAVRCAPNNLDALILRGDCNVGAGELDQAVIDYTAAIALEPANAGAYERRAEVYRRQGNREQSELDLAQVQKLRPRSRSGTDLTPRTGALISKSQGLTLDSDPVEDVETAYAAGDYERVIELANKALATKLSADRAAFVTMRRGNAQYSKGNLDQAIRDYDQSIRLNPNDATPYANRGLVGDKLGEKQKALQDFGEALRVNPQYWRARLFRAAQLRKMGKLDKALADVDEAIRSNPKSGISFRERGAIHIAQKQFDKAVEDFNNSIALDSDSLSAYIGRAWAYAGQKKYPEALADLDTVPQLNAKDANIAFNSVAWVQATFPDAKLRDGKKAVEHAMKACEIENWREWGHIDTVAAAYAEAGDFDKAIKYQELAIKMMGPQNQLKAVFQKRLELYRQHKPYREEPEL